MASNFNHFIQNLNGLLGEMSRETSLEKGLEAANLVVSLLTSEDLRAPQVVIDDYLVPLPNAERQDHWFMKHPWMGDERAAFDLFDGETVPIQGKFYWMKKRSRQYVSGGVHLTENWEDRDFTRNDDYKIGIDFFLRGDGKSLLVVLSNRGNLRLIDLENRLSNTQIDIFKKWDAIRDNVNQIQIHQTLWESFKLQSVNDNFYLGVSDSFNELLQHLRKIGKDEEAAKLFSSRLLGRIMFTWFLRSMNLINGDIGYFDTALFDSTEYYRRRLEPLFFETLNSPMELRGLEMRNQQSASQFEVDLSTPYLNGGLFEPHEDDWYGEDSLSMPEGFFERLFAHFENFNFTTDESTPEYEQVAIDPEMLGRVFESLLATQLEESGAQARKAKGAFYTPREVVAYMCKEAIRSDLHQKFHDNESALKAIDALIDTEDREWAMSPSNYLRDKIGAHKEAIISALDVVNTIDPACGSGAFPMGMLSALLRLRERLEPAADRHSIKLSILQNSIFGVDIEPMAVEISRLRAWLSIIVDADLSKNIEPLPNLDFRFVCANTLLPLVSKGEDLALFDSVDVEDDLVRIRSEYFSATDMGRKNELRLRYKELIAADPDSLDGLRSRQLKSYNPFEYDRPADFFDPKTMFGVGNTFDIVIGNPPYISALAAKKTMNAKLRERYKELYTSAAGAYDMYILFLEKGLRLAGKHGTLAFITPTKFLSAKYAEAFRSYSWQALAMIADFENQKVFDSAGVSTLVSLFRQNSEREYVRVEKFKGTISEGALKTEFTVSSLTEFPENLWGHLKWGDYDLVSSVYKHSIPLEQASSVVASTTAAEADDYSVHVTSEFTPNAFRKVNTGNISPVFPLWGIKDYSNKKQKIREPYLPAHAPNDRRREMFGQPKVIISKLSKRLTAMYDAHGHYASSNTVFVLSPHDPFTVASIAAILNSSFMQYMYKTMFSGLNLLGSFQFQAPQIRLLPVPKNPRKDDLRALDSLIQRLLEQGHGHIENAALINEMNTLVYKLYGLDKDTIERIEEALELHFDGDEAIEINDLILEN